MDKRSHSDHIGIDCKSMKCFIVANQNKASIYEYDTFKPLNQIEIKSSFFQNHVAILDIKLSKNENILAMIMGKKMSNMKYEITNLLIYEQDKNKQNYFFRYMCNLPQEVSNACINFDFSNDNINEILFTNSVQITRYNYMTLETKTHYSFKLPLNCQPDFVVFS